MNELLEHLNSRKPLFGEEEANTLLRRYANEAQRIESRNALQTLIHAEKLGLGSQEYELINIDGTL